MSEHVWFIGRDLYPIVILAHRDILCGRIQTGSTLIASLKGTWVLQVHADPCCGWTPYRAISNKVCFVSDCGYIDAAMDVVHMQRSSRNIPNACA